MAQKIGLMGGTYNPIHIGHLILAQEALIEYGFEKIIIIPNKIPPHRQKDPDLATGEQRYIMVNLAVASNPLFFPSRIEIDRDEVSYTLETVQMLKQKHPATRFSFITGVDSILKDKWVGFDELLALLEYFICATRPGFDEDLLYRTIRDYNVAYPEKIRMQRIPAVEVSSTLIRRHLKQGRSIKYMVTRDVESFIYKNNLYNSADALKGRRS